MMHSSHRETRLVWIWPAEKVRTFSYVREGTYWTTRYRGPIKKIRRDWPIVAYVEVARDSTRRGLGVYKRRFWWLKDYDRALAPQGVYAEGQPAEAVDPKTIRLRV